MPNRRISGGDIINEISVEGDVEIPTSYKEYAKLIKDLDASVQVGGVDPGDHYDRGTLLEDILRDILDPVLNPTLTPPSASIQSSISTLLESGSESYANLTIIFNRGSISPAYGTSGYRSGPASNYILNGNSKETNQFLVTVSESISMFNAKVLYESGEQPKDSEGNDYSESLPAGQVSSSIIFEFAPAIWANTQNIASVSKLPLVSRSKGSIIFDFPAQTVTNSETFDIPSSWTVNSVEVLNTLSGKYEDCSFEFSTSTVQHNDAAGDPINYIRYRDNRGYAADGRTIKVTWT